MSARGRHRRQRARARHISRISLMLSAGGALRWYRDVLCDGERVAAELRGADPYEIITDAASTAREGARAAWCSSPT